MDYVKPKKNLRLKARIILKYGTSEDFATVLSMPACTISKIISNRFEVSAWTKALFANRLECKIMDIF
jgi:hypothetical protein